MENPVAMIAFDSPVDMQTAKVFCQERAYEFQEVIVDVRLYLLVFNIPELWQILHYLASQAIVYGLYFRIYNFEGPNS